MGRDVELALDQLGSHSVTKGTVSKLLGLYENAFVLFSGGLDSLCAQAYVKSIAEEMGKNAIAIHVNTTAGLPIVEDYVRSVCKHLNVELVVVKPEEDFLSQVRKRGIPQIRSRWCCYKLKIEPLKKYLERIPSKVVFDGIQAEESSRRRKYVPVWYHPMFRCVSVSPIFYWSAKRVREYYNSLLERGLPRNPVEDLGFSAECFCGAYANRETFELLLKLEPEMFEKFMEIEEERGFSFLYERGRPLFLRELKESVGQDKRDNFEKAGSLVARS